MRDFMEYIHILNENIIKFDFTKMHTYVILFYCGKSPHTQDIYKGGLKNNAQLQISTSFFANNFGKHIF